MTHKPISDEEARNAVARAREDIREAKALANGERIPLLRLHQHPSRKI